MALTNGPKPHLWQAEMPLLVQQSVLYLRGAEISTDALSKAKFHQQTPSFRSPFYLRQYGGKHLLDQIVLEFSPADDFLSRRATLTMSIKNISEDDLRSKTTNCLQANGFTPTASQDSDYTLYSDGKDKIEVFIHLSDDQALVTFRDA